LFVPAASWRGFTSFGMAPSAALSLATLGNSAGSAARSRKLSRRALPRSGKTSTRLHILRVPGTHPNGKVILMKKLALHKIVVLIAALAVGSASIAGDALARGGGGGGGGGFGGGGGGGFGGGGGHGGDGFGGGGPGGGGFGGHPGGLGGGHMGGFGGGHFAGGYGGPVGHYTGPRGSYGGAYANRVHGGGYDHNNFDHRHVRIVAPFLYDDFYDYDYGYDNDCWQRERVRARTGFRYRNVWACY
jgi:hypothetical protein